MNEQMIRTDIQQAMMNIGLEYYHPADTGPTFVERPDILSINGVVIECKTLKPKRRVEPWFNPKEISNKQRRQLDYYCFTRHFLTFLAIGTLWQPRRMWCIPWISWVNMENSLFSKDGLDFRITISSLGIYPWGEMTRNKTKKKWEFQDRHPIFLANNRQEHKPEDWNPISIRFPEPEKKQEA